MEFLLQYDFTLNYIPGKDNLVVDALLQWPGSNEEVLISLMIVIENKKQTLETICASYNVDNYTEQILADLDKRLSPLEIEHRNRLLYVRDYLIISNYCNVHKNLFHITHDKLEHFGADKIYAAL